MSLWLVRVALLVSACTGLCSCSASVAADGSDALGIDAADVSTADVPVDAPIEAWSDAGFEGAAMSCGDGGSCAPGEMCAYEPGCAMPRRHCIANTCGDTVVVAFCGCDGREFPIQGCLAPSVPFASAGRCAAGDARSDVDVDGGG